MEFLKVFWKNKRLAWQLGKNDFKNRFANTSLGSIWGFLQPFVFMMMYVIVFQYIFKQTGPGGAPYVYMVCGCCNIGRIDGEDGWNSGVR